MFYQWLSLWSFRSKHGCSMFIMIRNWVSSSRFSRRPFLEWQKEITRNAPCGVYQIPVTHLRCHGSRSWWTFWSCRQIISTYHSFGLESIRASQHLLAPRTFIKFLLIYQLEGCNGLGRSEKQCPPSPQRYLFASKHKSGWFP